MAQVAGLQAEMRGVRTSMAAAQQAADAAAQDATKHGAEFAAAVRVWAMFGVPAVRVSIAVANDQAACRQAACSTCIETTACLPAAHVGAARLAVGARQPRSLL